MRGGDRVQNEVKALAMYRHFIGVARNDDLIRAQCLGRFALGFF
jgi:hypothetical protein